MKGAVSAFVLFCFCTLFAESESIEEMKQVQSLHNRISEDLMSIKKTFPKSQRTVYGLLDQVCKIYKISKEKIKSEAGLRVVVKEKLQTTTTLQQEVLSLKTELHAIKGELDVTKDSLRETSKQLEDNTIMLSKVAEEKQNLEKEKQKLDKANQQLLQSHELDAQASQYQSKSDGAKPLVAKSLSRRSLSVAAGEDGEMVGEGGKGTRELAPGKPVKAQSANPYDLKSRHYVDVSGQSFSVTSTSDPSSPL